MMFLNNLWTLLIVVFGSFLFSKIQNVDGSVIIVEDAKACYRRVLAGKRVLPRHILRVIACERLEDCQRLCADERRFDCETFNYRLDPSNRGKGVCELTPKPVSYYDLRNDFVEDRDYDFYELDRNSAPDCSLTWPEYPTGNKYHGSRPNYGGYSHGSHGQGGYSSGYGSQGNRWGENRWEYQDKRVGYGNSDRLNWNGWHDRNDGYKSGGRPTNSYRRWDRDFIPYDIDHGGRKTWGKYGGSYGHGSDYQSNHVGHGSAYDYWGLNQGYNKHYLPNSSLYPQKGVYHYGDSYDDHHKKYNDFNYYNLGHVDDYKHHKYHDRFDGANSWGGYGSSYGYKDHGSWSSSHGVGSQDHYHHDHHSHHDHDHHDHHSHHDHDHHDHHSHHDHDHHGSGEYDHGNDLQGFYGVQPKPYDCSARASSGFRHSSGVARQTLSVPDIYACERLCYEQPHFRCASYSYRYTHSPSDNCYLSAHSYGALDLYNDIQPDRDFDIYSMNEDSGACKAFLEHHRHHYEDADKESDCFWRVRSGRRLQPTAVRISLVADGIAHCEAECLRLQTFTCRAFSYRHGPPVIGEPAENCQLTDLAGSALGGGALDPAASCELYQRGSYGRGCEADRPPIKGGKAPELCYLQYDTSAKLVPGAVRDGTRVLTEEACKDRCAALHVPGPHQTWACMSFSYSSDPHLPPHKDNCLLSDIQLRDLQPGIDYTAAVTHWLFAYNTFDPECDNGHSYHHHHHYPSSSPGVEPPYNPTGGPICTSCQGIPSSSGPSGPPGITGPSGYPNRPPYGGHDGPSGHGSPGYGEPSGPTGPSRPSGSGHGYNTIDRDDYGDLGDVWAVFTVSGWPCRRGTRCAQNKVAGHWSCELEGGEVGAWDYCCRPSHHCGHSRHFSYPWCYVGSAGDQWRPCSDRYFPYAHSGGSSSSDSYGGRPSSSAALEPYGGRPGSQWDRPSRPYLPDRDRNDVPGHYNGGDRRYWEDLHKNGPQSFYDEWNNPRPGYVRVPTIEKNRVQYHHNYGPSSRPHGHDGPQWVPVRAPSGPDDDSSGPGFLDPPKPGGFGVARYWPVAYLHKDAPPNSTFYKSDKEYHRNSIPRRDFERKPSPIDRRPDDISTRKPNMVEEKKVEDKGNKQVLTIDTSGDAGRNGRDRENGERQNVTKDKKVEDDSGLVLVSSSSDRNKSDLRDPMDKSGRIVQANASSVSDKLERFPGDAVEVFTVDENLKSNEKDSKASLERLLKEEKQIEEIGKTFGRKDDRTSVEKRNQNGFYQRDGNVDRFLPIFVPVNVESKFEKIIDASSKDTNLDTQNRSDTSDGGRDTNTRTSDNRGGRSFSRNFNNNDDTNNDQVSNSGSVLFDGRKGLFFGGSHIFTGGKNPVSVTIAAGDSRTSRDNRRNEEKAQSNASTTSTNSERKLSEEHKSVVSNGQVFYEVSPVDDNKQMAHIERVELDNYANVKVPNQEHQRIEMTTLKNYYTSKDPTYTDRPNDHWKNSTSTTKTINEHHIGGRSDVVDSVSDSRTSPPTQSPFGTRTGRVRKVELPFIGRTINGSRLVRRGRRNFRISYNPSEVRKRLLEQQKIRDSMEKQT